MAVLCAARETFHLLSSSVSRESGSKMDILFDILLPRMNMGSTAWYPGTDEGCHVKILEVCACLRGVVWCVENVVFLFLVPSAR